MKQFLIEIGYKSGNKVKMWVKDYEITKKGSKLESISITHIGKEKFIYIGIDDIEYIVCLKVKSSYFWGLIKF